MKFQKDVSLKKYTTFRIGGKAKYFFSAKNKEELALAVKSAEEMNLPFFVLGQGSNVLVSDEGFKGLVIKMQNSKIKMQNEKSKCKIFAEAGALLAKLVKFSKNKGLTGLEWAAGIPGSVGGAVFGNAGAFGKSMDDIVKKIEVFETKSLKFKHYTAKECSFNYRKSLFKRRKGLIIFSITLGLKKGNKKNIQKKIKEYLTYRKERHPLDFPSAGSVFKNPKGFSAARLGDEDKSSSSSFAAARLIEKCGLKGKRIGGVKISEKHANFIVNLGSGRAEDVRKLMNLTKQKVKNKFKIILEEEIRFLK
ncbi:MAG: UDP-N-acetylmuramate dehydrogenase [bacterium]